MQRNCNNNPFTTLNCNTKKQQIKIHTIHVNKTNLTIYINKFQHGAHLVL